MMLSFICSGCGGFGHAAEDSLDSGTTLTCDGCGAPTVVELFSPDGYKKRHEMEAQIEKLKAAGERVNASKDRLVGSVYGQWNKEVDALKLQNAELQKDVASWKGAYENAVQKINEWSGKAVEISGEKSEALIKLQESNRRNEELQKEIELIRSIEINGKTVGSTHDHFEAIRKNPCGSCGGRGAIDNGNMSYTSCSACRGSGIASSGKAK